VNVSGERTFAAPRGTVWRVMNDPEAMARTMPGVQSFDVHDDRHWTANVKIPLGLGGLKMTVDMEKVEEREPDFAKMAIKGNGVGAIMNMETSFTLADADAGVEPAGNDIRQSIVDHDIEHDIRMRCIETSEPRCDHLSDGHAERIDAQRAGSAAGSRHGLGDRSVQLQHHGCDALVQPSPGRRGRHAARGAIQKPHPKTCLQLADRLAQR